MILICGACQKQENNTENNAVNGENETTEQNENNNENEAEFVPDTSGPTPVVTMTMEDGGVVEIELYPTVAPNTVNNFITLVEEEFYDGVIFHRVIPGFMVQGGDPEGTGMGGPGYTIPGEFILNDFPNELKHTRGVLSMARSTNPDSAGSQFFIMTEDSPHLDGEYASFGKVIEGMDVVDEIVNTETSIDDKPVEDQVVESMTVDLDGYEVEEVEKS